MLVHADEIKGETISRRWVNQLGFLFNPFQYLEASEDPNLGQYLIGHELYGLAREDASGLVFSPRGGGKTAMRMYITRSCWLSLGGRHPFPVPYVLPDYAHNGQAVDIDQHYRWLIEASAQALLAGLAYRPERYLGMSDENQARIAHLINAILPGGPDREPLRFYMRVLQESETPGEMLRMLGWPAILTDPPSQTLNSRFTAKMVAGLQSTAFTLPGDIREQFETLRQLLLGPLNFRSIFILADGIDAFFETSNSVENACQLILPLIKEIPNFAGKNIFLKAFLPAQTSPQIEELAPEIYQSSQIAELRWTPELLAEMIRRRVYIASNGVIGSLDALCNPALRDIEFLLARALKVPIPREMLYLVEQLLDILPDKYHSSITICPEDFDRALQLYQESQTTLATI